MGEICRDASGRSSIEFGSKMILGSLAVWAESGADAAEGAWAGTEAGFSAPKKLLDIRPSAKNKAANRSANTRKRPCLEKFIRISWRLNTKPKAPVCLKLKEFHGKIVEVLSYLGLKALLSIQTPILFLKENRS